MLVIKTVSELNSKVSEIKQQHKSLGFVPTMGALHEGHLTLVKRAVAENDFAIVSIFVNPTQFNNSSDLEKYPRNLDADVSLLEKTGCFAIFAPDVDEMYNNNEKNTLFDFDFEGLDKVMEGKFRPGHFNGVVQVVSKLFDFVKPDNAYFGEKDFQQLAIIHLMTKRLGYAVRIIDCAIVREKSGLAMSSRNERLTAEQRLTAVEISRILFESKQHASDHTPVETKEFVETEIKKINGLTIEYFEISDAATLQPVNNWTKPTVGCIAVFCGEVRLIDNIRYQQA